MTGLKSATTQLRPLVDESIARGKKSSQAPGSVLATRTDVSGALGPLQTITFDAPTPYVPQTTGNALLICNCHGDVSNTGDGVVLTPRTNTHNVSSIDGNANNSGSGTAANGGISVVVPIVQGVPITPGVQATDTVAGHTIQVGAAGLQVTIIELQTH